MRTPFLRPWWLLAALLLSLPLQAQPGAFGLPPGAGATRLDRRSVVRRHNPEATQLSAERFLLGSGFGHFSVDATALQSLPVMRAAHGALLPFAVGLRLGDNPVVDSLHMTLDRWTGKAESRFRQGRQHYHVESLCMPGLPGGVAIRISSDSLFEVVFRPLPGQTADQPLRTARLKHHAALKWGRDLQGPTLLVDWVGKASVRKRDGQLVMSCRKGTLELYLQPGDRFPGDDFFNEETIPPFTDHALATATGWNTFWRECGLADFSGVADSTARWAESTLVEALYELTAAPPEDWWEQTPLLLWGFPGHLTEILRQYNRRHPALLAQRPEFVAAALIMRHAVCHPLTASRLNLSAQHQANLWQTITASFAGTMVQAATHLAATSPDSLARVLPEIDAARLLSEARHWADSLPSGSDATTAPAVPDTTAAPLFRLPLLTDLPTGLTPARQRLLLFYAVAARRWPDSWAVQADGILPPP